MSDSTSITVALAGNPNSGKTTIFNALTGARRHVGNYPGVTVDIKRRRARYRDLDIDVVDLPGTYSLTAHSAEEIVARNFVMDTDPDVVIDILDASNLERNLYLATQLLELGTPLVLAFNMSDVARSRGYRVDEAMLSELLGVPIVATVGHKGAGVDELLAAAAATAQDREAAVECQRRVDYGAEVEPHVQQLTELIDHHCGQHRHARWFALKMLEGDDQTAKRISHLCGDSAEEIRAEADRLGRHIESVCGDPPEIILADRRYGFVSGACTEAVTQTVESRHIRSDKIDAVLTHRLLGLPIFAVLMYLTFYLTFTVGAAPMGWLETAFEWLGGRADLLWAEGSDSLLRSLLVEGVIGGVGGVLAFVPNIVLLFAAIAVLEDTGYMARAAFIMDRAMHKIGLHGKSFIPMVTGFGCSVPAIMATRTLDSRRDRLVTMMVIPLMSCGARLPIYALIIPAFFSQHWRAPVMWSIYVVGIVLAIVGAKLLRVTLFKGESTPLVMELPPYRVPTLKGLALHVWEPTAMYARKAATIILCISIVMWALTTLPRKDNYDSDYDARIAAAESQHLNQAEGSLQVQLDQIARQRRAEELSHTIAGRIGHGIEPVIQTMGFDWKIGTALVGAMAAKEVFVAQMGIVYAAGGDERGAEPLRAKLRNDYSPLTAYCIMLFCLITTPCVATFAVMWRESGRLKWALFQATALTVLAYVVTTAVYQVGRWFT